MGAWLAGVLVLALAAGAAPRPGCAADGGCAMAGKVTLRGVAEDAKAGAVLVADDGRTLYLAGLDAWPSRVRGKRVEVTGTLAEEKLIPDPGTNPITAGAYGTQSVLREPAWRLLE